MRKKREKWLKWMFLAQIKEIKGVVSVFGLNKALIGSYVPAYISKMSRFL